jgi:T5SS/PEP-CTERM-associated repeat protein
LGLVLISAPHLARPAHAVDRFWQTATGGAFNTAVNWDGGASVPGALDVANFTLNNTYDVTFSGNVTNSELEIENGNVTFDLEGFTYTATAAGAIDVGKVAGQTGRLTVLDGTVAVDTISDDVFVGLFNDSTGFLTIGTGGQVGTTGARPDIVIGNSGTATLTIQNDGQMFASSFDVGNNEGSSGTVTITGPQASLNASQQIIVGDAGNATMTVSGGAEVICAGFSTIGDNPGISGTVTVTGAGTSWTQTSSVSVGEFGVGTLNVQSGGTFASSSATLGDSGFGTANVSGSGSRWTLSGGITIAVDDEGVMNVTNGGQVSSAGSLTMASFLTGQGTATVSGAGSRADFVGDISIGTAGKGTLTISSGGQVTSEEGRIAAMGASASGEVTITGAGSSWTTTSNVAVGTIGTGTLNVENGGSLNVATTLSLGDFAGAPVGTLNFHGGTISTDSFTRAAGAVLNWTDGTLSVVGGTFSNAGSALTLNGADADDRPTLRLTTGSATGVAQLGALIVGDNRGGALEVTGGSGLQVPSISIGAADGGDGVVTVSGNFSGLAATTGNINVGGTTSAAGGTGTLNIETGALVDTPAAGQLRLYAGGTVNINGGTLRYGSLTLLGGKVNFNSGLIIQFNNLTADDITLSALLGEGHELGSGRIMSTSGTASVSADLDINGGRLEANVLDVQGVAGDVTTFRIRGGGVADFNSSVGLGLFSDVRTYVDDGTLIAGTHIDQFGELYLSGTARVSAGSPLNNQGLIAGSGRIDASLDNQSFGQVRIATGERLVFNSSNHDNDGLVDVNGGELEIASGTFNNSTVSPSTGIIAARNATLRFAGGLTNNGAMTFTSGVSEVFGNVTNTNALTTPGRIVVSGGAQANFYDDVTNNGAIQVSAAGALESAAVFLGSFSGNGVSGGGHVFLEGDVRPGFSPGTMAFGGDLSFGVFAGLEIELAGTTPGTQFDRLTVADQLVLDGSLDVTLLGGFTPTAGDSFEIITATGGLTGTFANELLPDLGASLEWDVVYDSDSVTLQVSPVLFGDYNDDGAVDAADYVMWRKLEGTSTVMANDPNPLPIDGDQYSTWRRNYGEGGSGAGSEAVPEPVGWIMGVVMGAVACGVRWRSQVNGRLSL